jgi:hypothetical protein
MGICDPAPWDGITDADSPFGAGLQIRTNAGLPFGAGLQIRTNTR